MRITDERTPRPQVERPDLAERVAPASAALWLAMALAGAVGVIADLGLLASVASIVVLGLGTYCLGTLEHRSDPELTARARRYERERDLLLAAELRRSGFGADAPRPEAPKPERVEPRPFDILSRRRSGPPLSAAAAVDALDAPLPGEAPGLTSAGAE